MKLLLICIALSFSIPSFANEFTFETNAGAKEDLGSLQEKSAQAQDHDRLILANLCHETIRVYLAYVKLDGTWDLSPGYFQVLPGQSSFVARTRYSTYYIAAISESGRYIWKGNVAIRFDDGTTLGMIEKKILSSTWGDWTQQLSCNN
ncbi:hypothetical protein SHI21_17575 [Bacteriovorax sp. PP10]|uniref:Uncharacterized protein n=1 Tax=Bacteriovorax antarcticus TaxID=3088717 RepID=A0ABU5VYK9_9BACT|nr:hypothetical protein [Bacteriovorax sp. PP10]MEA9358047.1 hypothetical protein [Bacteriovorax sp. PP10]